MNVTKKWTRVVQRSLTNLNVLNVNGKDVGFIYKPLDSKSDKNAWRVHRGLGNDTDMVCHAWTKSEAQRRLEEIFVGKVQFSA
jgi:hypothetical protein